jgi:hypothetical protein
MKIICRQFAASTREVKHVDRAIAPPPALVFYESANEEFGCQSNHG